MKEKLMEFTIKFVCILIVYVIIIISAYKLKLIEDFAVLYLSMGFIMGWSTVQITNLFQKKKEEKKKDEKYY